MTQSTCLTGTSFWIRGPPIPRPGHMVRWTTAAVHLVKQVRLSHCQLASHFICIPTRMANARWSAVLRPKKSLWCIIISPRTFKMTRITGASRNLCSATTHRVGCFTRGEDSLGTTSNYSSALNFLIIVSRYQMNILIEEYLIYLKIY